VVSRPAGRLVRIVPREDDEPARAQPEVLPATAPIAPPAAPPAASGATNVTPERPPQRRTESGTRTLAVHAPVLDDAEILEGVRGADPSAAAALHDRARPQVDRTIVRLLGRRDRDHEDLVQLSMIELVRSLRGFRGECSLDTWTSRVTAHTVFKELRRRRTERNVFDVGADASVLDVAPGDPDHDAAMRSSLRRVRHHLSTLDPVKAWTVLLHDVSGYDLREIAEITEVSVAAAQTRLVRGRRELHARIEADPDLRELLEQMRGRS
jgi:RNA polymerase sigma-70 factor (ECF subfamily)